MTIALPERTHGRGETESFRLLDDPGQLRAVTRETQRVTVRYDEYGSPLETLKDSIRMYVPMILAGSAKRDARLQTIGLDRLAEAERIARRLELTSYVYPELVDESYELWNKFLPTRYRLEAFAYDSIPNESLGFIEKAQAIGVFDRIIIWTPEGNNLAGRLKDRVSKASRELRKLVLSVDPMAVGVITDPNGVNRFYSIVRWGESLAPVEEIAQYVKKVDAQERASLIVAAVIAVAIIVGLISITIVTHFAALAIILPVAFIAFLVCLFR